MKFAILLSLASCAPYSVNSLIVGPAAFDCTGKVPAEPSMTFSFWGLVDGSTMADAGPMDGSDNLNKGGSVFRKAPDSSCFKAEDGMTWCFAKEDHNVRIDRYDSNGDLNTVLASNVCD